MMPCSCQDGDPCLHPGAQNCQRSHLGSRGRPLVTIDPLSALMAKQTPIGTYSAPKHGWTCYHCGETFTEQATAAEHFGLEPGADPTCVRRFRHFKGGEYTFVCEATHSETMEKMVVYRSEEAGRVFVRPAGMFYGVTEDGQRRFQEI